MDWKLFFATFVTIFVAEIGDKTQLAAFSVSSGTKNTWTVLIAVVAALSLAGTLGVLGGALMGHYVSPAKLQRISGAFFILMGLWMIFRR